MVLGSVSASFQWFDFTATTLLRLYVWQIIEIQIQHINTGVTSNAFNVISIEYLHVSMHKFCFYFEWYIVDTEVKQLEVVENDLGQIYTPQKNSTKLFDPIGSPSIHAKLLGTAMKEISPLRLCKGSLVTFRTCFVPSSTEKSSRVEKLVISFNFSRWVRPFYRKMIPKTVSAYQEQSVYFSKKNHKRRQFYFWRIYHWKLLKLNNSDRWRDGAPGQHTLYSAIRWTSITLQRLFFSTSEIVAFIRLRQNHSLSDVSMIIIFQ